MDKISVDNFMAKPITDKAVLEENSEDIRTKMELMILKTQAEFCRKLEKFEEDKKFQTNTWKHPEGGVITCLLEGGTVFDKACINVSIANGILPSTTILMLKKRVDDFPDSNLLPYFSAGINCTVHPKNPYVPIFNFNYWYFEVHKDDGKKTWWFGGFTDMTPYFFDEDSFRHFHSTLKSCCDKYDSSYYSLFKKQCDEYFYLKHKEEYRGIGGIFFNDLNTPDQEKCFEFISMCANSAIPSYIEIVINNMDKSVSYNDRKWQHFRNGSYVEFNLLYDKFTKSVLMAAGARYENILMSLPPFATWQHSYKPELNTNQKKLLEVLKKPQNWV